MNRTQLMISTRRHESAEDLRVDTRECVRLFLKNYSKCIPRQNVIRIKLHSTKTELSNQHFCPFRVENPTSKVFKKS